MTRRLTIAIPASNEAELLPRSLRALASQRDLTGEAVGAETFDVLVFCNGCDDGTPAVARRFATENPSMRLVVVEAVLPAGEAHVGFARRAALDLAAARFEADGRSDGIVASTDADTVPSPTWVAQILREMRGVDAVAGFVSVSAADRDAMLAPQRLLYDRELAYRQAIGLVQARFDPRPYDPSPRHDAFVGAGFAMTTAIYRRAGGLPPLPCLEDRAMYYALDRIDARVRHSYAVEAFTSPRASARVSGGFGHFLSELAGLGHRREAYAVRAGRGIVDEATARGAARDVWNGAPDSRRAATVRRLLGCDAAALAAARDGAATFGVFWASLRANAPPHWDALEPVEAATAALRRVLVARGEGAGVRDPMPAAGA